MVLPEAYKGQNWYRSFEQFMTEVYPDWYKFYDCAPATLEEIKEAAGQLVPEVAAIPEEYMIFLAHMGGRGLNLNSRAILYPLYQMELSPDKPACLDIGTYDYYYESRFLAYSFSREELPCLILRDEGEKPLKAADCLGQLLCGQAFLSNGMEQFKIRYPMDLAFHLHQPPYSPCPEAENYYRTHPVEGFTERDLENIGFQIQVEKLEKPLRALGYERTWFSTELDHIWIKEDTCCILSRNFDPNDMFDTLNVSLWGMEGRFVQELAERFKTLGYGNYLELRDGSHPALRGI